MADVDNRPSARSKRRNSFRDLFPVHTAEVAQLDHLGHPFINGRQPGKSLIDLQHVRGAVRRNSQSSRVTAAAAPPRLAA